MIHTIPTIFYHQITVACMLSQGIMKRTSFRVFCYTDSMNIEPVVFQENNSFYEEFGKKYIRHEKGLFILGPSGSGKSYYCKNQKDKHWIDGDELWTAAKAHPDGPWWKEPIDVMDRIDCRSDVITMEAKKQGFWIMGASNHWLKPDAIVIPDWETHKRYIVLRETENYDGGATSEDYLQVKGHIEFIKKWNTDYGVPMYSSIQEAVENLTD